jgi:hypothetical protein
MADSDRIMKLLEQAKQLAIEYRQLTGRPLGVTGEVAEYEAARILGLELSDVRQPGYDAVKRSAAGERRYQVKGRCILESSKPCQRIGSIRFEHDWDAVLLVLLNQNLETTAIYEADREPVRHALLAPGSRARNERGALSVSRFKAIGQRVWPTELPPASLTRVASVSAMIVTSENGESA